MPSSIRVRALRATAIMLLRVPTAGRWWTRVPPVENWMARVLLFFIAKCVTNKMYHTKLVQMHTG